jgi:putative peptidoglycan binding protein
MRCQRQMFGHAVEAGYYASHHARGQLQLDAWGLAGEARSAENVHAFTPNEERMMKHMAQPEVDLSRRKFLKVWGLLGLSLGVLGLPALGRGERSDMTTGMAEDDNRLVELHHKHSGKKNNMTKQAQQQLKAAGFDPGPVDGHMGPSTRAALSSYQAAHNLPKTGKLDRATHKSLMAGG